jgi:hypothetical protein
MGDLMRLWFLAAFVCLFSAPLLLAQKEGWLPITPEEMQMKEVPADPGASAVLLYYAHYIDDNVESEFIYKRIKILKEDGKKYANVEIEVGPFSSLHDLKARTIRTDGSIVEFTGKPFDKVLFRGRNIKVQAKSFTLPEAEVGSIVECRYNLMTPWYLILDEWVLQHELYTVKESFSFRPYASGVGGLYRQSGPIAWVTLRLRRSETPVRKGNLVQLDTQDVPAFKRESHMPPEENYKPLVRFFYLRSGINSADQYWDDVGKRLGADVQHFIGNSNEVKQAAAETIGSEGDPEKKLRKLYERAQQVRNLSFERRLSEEERKKQGIKENENAGDVLKHGYGHQWEIARLFVALARAAGFDASILRASSRRTRFFTKEVLSSRQLDAEIVLVLLNGNELYLDPGTRFCPYGLVRWIYTSTAAMNLAKSSVTFVTVPPAKQDKAVIKRTANVTVSEDGSLKGEIIVEFKAGEALERRLEALNTDEAGKTKLLEDELRHWLPSGTMVKMLDAQGWEAQDSSLVARFSVEAAAYASVAGKRFLTPPYLFRENIKDTFVLTERTYPVYFPYAFAEIDKISMSVPAGYTIESLPGTQNLKLPYAQYQNIEKFEGSQLTSTRALLVNGVFFSPGQYAELRDFFSKVRDGDEQQAVLYAGK